MAFIYENTDYASKYAETVKGLLNADVVFEQRYATEEKDFALVVKPLANRLNELDALILVPQTDITFMSLLSAFEKENMLTSLKDKIYTTAVVWTSALFEKRGDQAESIASVQLPDYALLGKKSEEYVKAFTKNHQLKTNELYAVFFKEGIDLVLRGIQAGHTSSEDLQNYLRSFDQNKLIDGYWGKYYFEGSDAIGLRLTMQKALSGKLEVIE